MEKILQDCMETKHNGGLHITVQDNCQNDILIDAQIEQLKKLQYSLKDNDIKLFIAFVKSISILYIYILLKDENSEFIHHITDLFEKCMYSIDRRDMENYLVNVSEETKNKILGIITMRDKTIKKIVNQVLDLNKVCKEKIMESEIYYKLFSHYFKKDKQNNITIEQTENDLPFYRKFKLIQLLSLFLNETKESDFLLVSEDSLEPYNKSRTIFETNKENKKFNNLKLVIENFFDTIKIKKKDKEFFIDFIYEFYMYMSIDEFNLYSSRVSKKTLRNYKAFLMILYLLSHKIPTDILMFVKTEFFTFNADEKKVDELIREIRENIADKMFQKNINHM
jgi:hypothetical protein